jgi:hypothetical protein
MGKGAIDANNNNIIKSINLMIIGLIMLLLLVVQADPNLPTASSRESLAPPINGTSVEKCDFACKLGRSWKCEQQTPKIRLMCLSARHAFGSTIP